MRQHAAAPGVTRNVGRVYTADRLSTDDVTGNQRRLPCRRRTLSTDCHIYDIQAINTNCYTDDIIGNQYRTATQMT